MAGPQPAPGGAGQHPDWISSILEGIGQAAHSAAPALPGNSWVARTEGIRHAPPFGGHLVSKPAQPAPPGSGISAAFGGVPPISPSDEADLRQRQADFAKAARDIDVQNSWFAVPALAPEFVASLLDLAGAAGGAAIGSQFERSPLHFLEHEPWQRPPVGPPLNTGAKTALRSQARDIYAQAYGIAAKQMGAQVHHSMPLQWAHLFRNANPNRVANLWALLDDPHIIANNAWAEFARAMNGRVPSQAEVMAQKLKVDRLVAPYLRRAGIPRSPVPPTKGGGL